MDNLIRKMRIILRLKQILVLIRTPENKEIFYCKKGVRQHASLHSFPDAEVILNNNLSCAELKTAVRELFLKIDGTTPENIIILDERNEDGIFILCGWAKHPVSFTNKILGKQLLENVCIMHKQKKWNKHKSLQQEILSFYTNIGRLALEETKPENFYQEINKNIKSITRATSAGLFLYDEKSQYLVLQEPAFDILKSKKIGSFSVSLAEHNAVVNVFKNHRPVYKSDVIKDPFVLGNLTSLLRIRNIFLVPLLIESVCIGVYCFINLPDVINKEEERLIRQMMSQIAVFIRGSQQLKQLQNSEAEMRRMYQQEKENSSKYKYLMDVHQRLTAILMQETGLEEIVNRMARHFKMPVVLFDYLRWKRIPSDMGREKTDTFNLNLLPDFFKRFAQNPEMHSMKPFRETITINGLDNTVVIAALRVKNDLMGFVIVFEDGKKLSQLQMLAFDRAVHMCALEFLKQKMVFEVEQSLKDDFLAALIYWNEQKEKDIVNMAVNFGYDLSTPYLAAVLCLNNIPKREEPFLQDKKRILRLLSDTFNKYLNGGLVFFKGDDVILLIPYPKVKDYSSGHKQILNLASQMQRAVMDAVGIMVTIGVGSAAKELKEIKQSYNEARTTVDFLQQTGKQGIMFFHELGFYQLFLEQHDRKHLENIAKNQLKELIESDSTKGTSFLKTLERYFLYDGNLRETSEDLHIHLNTLRYRLKGLQDSFNIDLSSEKCKFDIHFAIKTLTFLCPELFKN